MAGIKVDTGSRVVTSQQGLPGFTDEDVFIYGQAADGGSVRVPT